MAKRKKPSKYQQELQRVRRRIRSLEKQGYIVDAELPKKTTLAKLKRDYSLEALYEKSFYVNPIGDIIPATEERKARRSESARKGWETRRGRTQTEEAPTTEYFAEFEEIVFNNLDMLISTIESWTPEPLWTDTVIAEKENQKDKLYQLLTSFSSKEQKLQAAERINENATEVNELAHNIMYETYRFDLVYYKPRGYYDFNEDYQKLAQIIGASGLTPFEDTGYDETY